MKILIGFVVLLCLPVGAAWLYLRKSQREQVRSWNSQIDTWTDGLSIRLKNMGENITRYFNGESPLTEPSFNEVQFEEAL